MTTIIKSIIAATLFLCLASCSESQQSNNPKPNVSKTMKCESCGKVYTIEDTYYDSERGYNVGCSSDHCAKCSARISRESNRKALQEGIKKARNTWVDNNPTEAKRRGIEKF